MIEYIDSFEQKGFPGIKLIYLEDFPDERGCFTPFFDQNDFAKVGLPTTFAGENQSLSKKNVLRGLHFQENFPQGKLVRVLSGKIYDVVVDLRKYSLTFGKWFSVWLSAPSRVNPPALLWIPPGFAHGFLSLEEDTQVLYKVTHPRVAEDERVLAWNDPSLAIRWPLKQEPLLSERDQKGMSWVSFIGLQLLEERQA